MRQNETEDARKGRNRYSVNGTICDLREIRLTYLNRMVSDTLETYISLQTEATKKCMLQPVQWRAEGEESR
jgi:hypothetical protein